MPAIVRMADLGLDTMWQDKPCLARWLATIRAHPAFEPTYYFGSLLTERFPHLKERAVKRFTLSDILKARGKARTGSTIADRARPSARIPGE